MASKENFLGRVAKSFRDVGPTKPNLSDVHDAPDPAGSDALPSKSSLASAGFASAEAAATDQTEDTAAGAEGISAIESAPRAAAGGFVNNVAGKALTVASRGKINGAKFANQKGPFAAIVGILLIVGAGFFIGQSASPFALVKRLQQEFNTQYVSNYKSQARVLKSMAKHGLISEDTQAKLKEQGITIENGKTDVTFQKSLDKDGRNQIKNDEGVEVNNDGTVKGNIDDAKIEDLQSKGYAISKTGDKVTVSKYPVTTSIKKAFKDSDFKSAYKTASAKWTGHYSGWFDSISKIVFKRLNIDFNTWKDYSNKEEDDGNGNKKTARDKLKETIAKKAGYVDGTTTGEKTTTTTDEDGNETTKTETSSDSQSTKGASKADTAAIKTKIQKVASGAAGAAGFASAGVCGYFYVTTAISAYSIAQQLMAAYAIAAPYLEAVQKVQAGDGDASPINEVMNTLFETADDGTNAMSSAGITALFGNTKAVAEETGSLEGVFATGGSNLGSYTTCLATQAAASGIGLLVSFIPGAGEAKSLIKVGAEVAVGALIQWAIGGIMEAIINQAVSTIATSSDIVKTLSGAALGSSLYTGANRIQSANAQASGASPATASALAAYYQDQQELIAEEAADERATLSPFDTSSEYTFLGSIIYNIAVPFASSTSTLSPASTIAGLGSTLSSSITNLLPSASALGQTSIVKNQGDCPVLQDAGAVGDVYCNPYYITDTSTIVDDDDNWTPEAIISYLVNTGDLTANTNSEKELEPTINDNTDLKRYIVYCGTRDTQIGLADSNITAAISNESTASSIVSNIANNPVLSAIPILGDAASLASTAQEAANQPWITGSKCVANDSDWWQSRGRYYQRFLEDQRSLVNAGAISKSAGESVLSAYYEENPLDQSYEGIIARFSGLTKDEVLAVEDYLDEQTWLATYDATDLGPSLHLAQNLLKVTSGHFDQTQTAVTAPETALGTKTTESIVLERVAYLDLRSRAVALG